MTSLFFAFYNQNIISSTSLIWACSALMFYSWGASLHSAFSSPLWHFRFMTLWSNFLFRGVFKKCRGNSSLYYVNKTKKMCRQTGLGTYEDLYLQKSNISISLNQQPGPHELQRHFWLSAWTLFSHSAKIRFYFSIFYFSFASNTHHSNL